MKAIAHLMTCIAAALAAVCCSSAPKTEAEMMLQASEDAIARWAGKTKNIEIALCEKQEGKDTFSVEADGGRLRIEGSSPSAICYAFNLYLREACNSMVTVSGKNLDLPARFPDYSRSGVSPYELRYFLNVCTFGYTTPYWDWERWSREIDWMVMHGVNMPLASVASEAIAKRVWMQLGLTSEEADSFFTGAAHLPWHRMGNINSFDGPLNDGWHASQIELQHKILDRMRSLGMEPVAPAFAGFIPPAFLEKHPEIQANQLEWGGFPEENNVCVLAPDSPWFETIGKMFITEWEKEFGKAKYWLSDSFNEMKLPVKEGDDAAKHALLAQYGKAIWNSIQAGDPDAVWVTQGWTFGYQHDFWDQESLKALLSEVPDDRLIIVDLGNDYPKWVWHTEQTWKVHEGFYGKRWIFSYVPNFGGKTLPTGDLDMYASASAEALASEYAPTLAGFGSAPEGIDNNDVVYELLSDMGWTDGSIDLDSWIRTYCTSRYGHCSEKMVQAWKIFRETVYSSLYSYPRYLWQTVVPDTRRVSAHGIDDDFGRAAALFLECADECAGSPLYMDDAIEFSAFWMGELADRHYEKALSALDAGKKDEAWKELAETISILKNADRLLASHSDRNLGDWVDFARKASHDKTLKNTYEANAKRLITTWGGWQEDYAARYWSGLVSDYYIPRLELYFNTQDAEILDKWEEEWIRTPYTGSVKGFNDPIKAAGNFIGSDINSQTEAAEDLVARITGNDLSSSFEVVVTGAQKDGRDWFSYYTGDNGKIVLSGNDGISVASALNGYLKSDCGWHKSWCGSDTSLPEVLPLPQDTVFRTSPYKYRYCLNYCTFNYTMSWWDEERWQQEIDFMAMNGINMPLAVTGQNTVWQKVYRRLGFTDEDLESFFSGPAYFNWFWMGNLDGWGGPLPQSFIDRHEALQKYILKAERSLGMTPVLPAFTGHVPPAFAGKFPDAHIRKTDWVNFPEVSILDPDEELFSEIGRMFIEEQTALYGTDHYYTADTFNENLPPTNDPEFLGKISEKVYHSMSLADPDAVWVMQGWLFYHEREFWGNREIKALLGAVPDDRMLILDLWSERYPVWSRTDAYYGKPWIWCMLHNFGQNITMSGNADRVAHDPAATLTDPSAGKYCGIGLTMEGIEQTPVMYALMLENVWRDTPIDEDSFIREYFTNRYGQADENVFEAWKLLFDTVFENDENNGGPESIITGRPTFKKNPGGTTTTKLHYDNADLTRAWDLLISVSGKLGDRDGYRYDLVDITRQVLANYASVLQQKAASAYDERNLSKFETASASFLELIDDMESLLSTREEFLLGRWTEAAKKMGTDDSEKALYEKNARNLLTTWGNRDCYLHDYACRQWAGMMSGFYRPRWEMFFSDASEALEAGHRLDTEAFEEKCRDWEWNWISGQEIYPDETSGDELDECKRIYEKYRHSI